LPLNPEEKAMSYKTEFDLLEIAEAEKLVAMGFEDTSWHNDAAPSFSKDCGLFRILRVWIDDADPEKREMEGARFALCEYSTEMDAIGDGTLCESDSFAEILAAIASYKPTLNSSEWVAENIFREVNEAMQNAEEMQGPDLPEYVTLMRAIARECEDRANVATGRA
jgi:hypothetical protein